MFVEEIATRLADAGLGALGTSILIGRNAVLPVDDGGYLVIVDTGGTGADRTQNGTAVSRPGAQIMACAMDPEAAYALAQGAFAAVGAEVGLHNITLSGVFYLSLTSRQQPTDTGPDDLGRARIVFNIDAMKAPS